MSARILVLAAIALSVIAVNAVFFHMAESRLGGRWAALSTWTTTPLSDRFPRSQRELLFSMAEHAPGAVIVRPFNRYPGDPMSNNFQHNMFGLARISGYQRLRYSPVCSADYSGSAHAVIEGPFGRGSSFELILGSERPERLVFMMNGPNRLRFVDQALLPRNFFRSPLLDWTSYIGEEPMAVSDLPRLRRDRRVDAASCDPDFRNAIDIFRDDVDILQAVPFEVAGHESFNVRIQFRTHGVRTRNDRGRVSVRWVALDSDGRRIGIGQTRTRRTAQLTGVTTIRGRIDVADLPEGTHSVRLGANARVARRQIRIGSISIDPRASGDAR
ncbi:MAG: hypothetical protein JJU26_06945 [Oceanicaulis sp.]|uniref:hypothetical protein n=1 Tax=Glycocaulis sp. TaxID=1969725 RepID=UPI0025C7078A|nr:hypothetical protein [Glycocaulis sp.]MCC5981441.1 hypothetical protein [Oceanicaulis sp.]MCH8521732.1 hypothetical protein [Glycocaulis sp.]